MAEAIGRLAVLGAFGWAPGLVWAAPPVVALLLLVGRQRAAVGVVVAATAAGGFFSLLAAYDVRSSVSAEAARAALTRGWVAEAHTLAMFSATALLGAALGGPDGGAKRDDRLVLHIVLAGLGALVLIHAVAVFGSRLVLGQFAIVSVAVAGTLVLAWGRWAARHAGAERGTLVALAVACSWGAARAALAAEAWSFPPDAPVSDVLRPVDDAASLQITGVGAVLQAVLVAVWVLPRSPNGSDRRSAWWQATPLVPCLLAGLALSSVTLLAVGGDLRAEGVALPRAHGPLPAPEGTCAAGLDGVLHRRLPAVPCQGAVVLAVPGDAPATALFGAGGDGPAEVLVRLPAIGTDRGPLLLADLAAVGLELSDQRVPSEFEGGVDALDDWDDWVRALWHGAHAPMWVVDADGGPMLLLRAMRGLPLVDEARRTRVFRTYLADTVDPRVVFVVGERWTVQRVVDLCLGARMAAGNPAVRCLMVRAAASQ